MPAVKTFRKQDDGDNQPKEIVQNVDGLVNKITSNMLLEAPGLVAEVESGKIEQKVLRKAIIQNIDRHKYYYGIDRDALIDKVFAYMFGYGILESLLDDEDISDIDFTAYNQGTIKKKGRVQPVDISFGSEKAFDTYCRLIAVRNGGILNENDTHCRVADEKRRLRINVSIRPRNITGPAISIRKHRKKSYTLEDLVELGMISEEMAELLCNMASSDVSPIFCGKGGSGKTTLLRAYLNSMNPLERVLVCESDSELYPDKPNCIVQRIKKKNEGGREVTLNDLVKDGLTMRLDAYCIGEIVGGEAWEYLKAGYTGHKVLASIHTWRAEDTFNRLLTMANEQKSKESEATIKSIIARSIDVIFYMKSFKAVDIVEVLGYDEKTDQFMTNRLYTFDIEAEDADGGLSGSFRKCGEPDERLSQKLRKGSW